MLMAEEEILGEGLFHGERKEDQDQDHGENGSEVQVPFGGNRCTDLSSGHGTKVMRRMKETRNLTIHLSNAMGM